MIYVDSDITYILDHHCKKYIAKDRLKDIESILPDNFIRANRQFILSRNSIKSFSSDMYGKIQVRLHCEFQNTIAISRDKAAQFRKWLNR